MASAYTGEIRMIATNVVPPAGQPATGASCRSTTTSNSIHSSAAISAKASQAFSCPTCAAARRSTWARATVCHRVRWAT